MFLKARKSSSEGFYIPQRSLIRCCCVLARADRLVRPDASREFQRHWLEVTPPHYIMPKVTPEAKKLSRPVCGWWKNSAEMNGRVTLSLELIESTKKKKKMKRLTNWNELISCLQLCPLDCFCNTLSISKCDCFTLPPSHFFSHVLLLRCCAHERLCHFPLSSPRARPELGEGKKEKKKKNFKRRQVSDAAIKLTPPDERVPLHGGGGGGGGVGLTWGGRKKKKGILIGGKC